MAARPAPAAGDEDDGWIREFRSNIQQNAKERRQEMSRQAEEQYRKAISNTGLDSNTRSRLQQEFRRTMSRIDQALKEEEDQLVEQEKALRLWTMQGADSPISEAMMREQQAILDAVQMQKARHSGSRSQSPHNLESRPEHGASTPIVTSQAPEDESRIPPISQNREVQSTEREWVQAAEEWVPEIQVKYETSLQQREEGLKDREALLTKREHDSKYEDDQRRHRESLFFARIVEASKRQSSWVSREESVRRHEMDLLEREDGLNSRHKGLLKREQELVKREEELMRRQQSLAQREAEIMRREDEFQQREGADLSEEGIKRAEEAVLRLQEQLASKTKEEKAKQMDISRKEQEIIIRENEVSRREIEVSRREGEQSKETGQSKASTISSYDDSFVRPKNSEGNLLSPSDIPRSRSANSSTSASQSNVGWDPTSQPFSPSGHMRSASVASRAGGRWLSGNSTGTEPDVPESTPRQAASQRSSTASSWSSARSTAASSWSSSRTSHPSRPASRASTASVNATRSSRSNSAEDRKTLQEELAKKQQEQFHVETQKSEMERLASAATSMNKDRVAKAWENYGAWWSTIAEQEILRFHTISWPTIAAAKSVDDLNMSAIGVFVLSPHHSYGKSAKDRIKEQLLRWHPDRFESKWLQKVPEGEKEVVKDGVGQVARVLSELLNRESYIHISS